MNIQKIISAMALFSMGFNLAYADIPSKFSNQVSISNTRHNLTQRPASGGINAAWMDLARNDYGEVCVYCHTPHGANANVVAPLWNRTLKATTYTTYNQLGTTSLTQTVSQPGISSLVCLSCHDGQTAMDSIINMPGSGRYLASQAVIQNNAFLDAWPGVGPGGSPFGGHGTLSTTPATLANFGECQACHSINGDQNDPSTTPLFDMAFISTDLRDDHPVGITFPATNGPGTDFKTPASIKGTTRYFDIDGNGKMDSAEVRLYDTGGGPQVECASCHDPHGVPSAGFGSTFKPTFLRVTNSGSLICLTCHDK